MRLLCYFFTTACESAFISKFKKMWDAAEPPFMDKFIALDASFRKEEVSNQ